MKSLPDRDRARRHDEIAARLDPDRGALVGAKACIFVVAGDTESEVAAFGPSGCPALLEIPDPIERCIEALVIVAAVVRYRPAVAGLGARQIGKLVFPNKASSTHLGAIKLQFARHAVDKAL